MISTLIFLSVAAFILLSSINSLRNYSRQPTAIPEELDLNSVRDAVMEKQGWSHDRAEAARTEYIRFLTLLQTKPGFMVIPWPTPEGNDDLDQFWHQHILDTGKYAADCNALFGRMLHHNPHVVRGSGQETDAVEKTQRLYALTFDNTSDRRSPDPILFSSCGAATTWDFGGGSSSDTCHSHASHSDSSHSCGGGHSCGGHSCGGHGCGGH